MNGRTLATPAKASGDHSRDPAPKVAGLGNAAARHPAAAGLNALGNQEVQHLFAQGAIQAKLAISQPGDPDEEEADRVADQIMRMEEPGPLSSAPGVIHRKCAACDSGGATCPKCEEEEKIQRKEKPGHRPHASPAVHSRIAALRGGGQPLAPSMRVFFEPRFGRDFSGVRVHTDGRAAESARTIQARAFTTGQNVVFGAGEYSSGSEAGMKLLAHELAHIAQGTSDTLRRDPLDPSNTNAWDWYGTKEHRADPSYLQTVDKASTNAAGLAKGMKDQAAPANEEEREAMRNKINTLIRLNAVAMVGAHRQELVERKRRYEAMLAAPPDKAKAEGSAASEAERRTDTAKAIKTAARSVNLLNETREKLQDQSNDAMSAVRVNAGREAIPDEFARLQKDSYPYPPSDLAEHVSATKEQMHSLSWGSKKLKLIDFRDYIVEFRKSQIGAVNQSLAGFYSDFPFLADLSAQEILTGHSTSKTERGFLAAGVGFLAPMLAPLATPFLFSKDQEIDDETLLKKVSESFERLLERVDEAIVKAGSGGIDPLDLPGAVAAARAALSVPLQTELDHMKQDHEVYKFTKDMALALGAAVLMGATGGFAGLGMAGWAAATGALSAGVGAYQLADQAKDLLDRQTVASAATNPQGELLGVSAPSTLEKVMLAVGVVLTAVELASVVQEIRSLRPHFAEEPHIQSGGSELAEEGQGLGGKPGQADPETMAKADKAVKNIDEHSNLIENADKPGKRRAPADPGHEIVEEPNPSGVGFHCEYHSTNGPTVPCPKGMGVPEAEARAASVVLDQRTVDDLIKMWEVEMANNPDQRKVIEGYIRNLRERKPVTDWRQTEKEVQYLYGSREQRVKTPEGLTKPDFAPATGWHGEAKNWNIAYPTETEFEAAAQGRLPSKLQGLVDQVNKRRLVVGDRQTVVIDIRGQFSVENVAPEVAQANRVKIENFRSVVVDATGLPRENIQVLTF